MLCKLAVAYIVLKKFGNLNSYIINIQFLTKKIATVLQFNNMENTFLVSLLQLKV